VLKGEMSLIGPRPERPEIAHRLERAIARYPERLQVRPGITGFAQVQLPYDATEDDVRRKLSYDLYYIQAVGPWLDLRILLCTALKMIGVPRALLGRIFAMPPITKVEQLFGDVIRKEVAPLVQPFPQVQAV
jgi:lipopolysaccharide/colanic/teichoic acid biosynthesis glycosyltransferase